MKRHLRLREEDGAAAVEFALLLPVLLLLVFGMVDFARGYNAHIALSGAAREGVRAVALSQGDWATRTIDAAPSLSGVTPVLIQDCSNGPGTPATVHAVYDYQFITPVGAFMAMFGGTAPGGTITLTGIGVMRCGG